LWIVFIVILFPLLTFGTMAMRYAFVNNAVSYAAEAAAQSGSYLVNPDSTHLSAVNAAIAVLQQAKSSWSGININIPSDITTSIVIEPLPTGSSAAGTPTSQTMALTSAQMAVQSQNVYLIQVTAKASIQPLIPQNYWQGGMAGIPGLNAPILVTCSQSKYFEDPTKLNQ
jgi:hypothetical protein